MGIITSYPDDTTASNGDKYLTVDESGATRLTSLSTLRDGVLSPGSVTAGTLAQSAVTLGYKEITTAFSTTSVTDVAITGLSVTFTVPAGGKDVFIDFDSPSVYNTAANYNTVKIWDGPIGSGTLIKTVATFGTNGTALPVYTRRRVNLSAGSHTINVSLNTNGGTASILANTTGGATSISARL